MILLDAFALITYLRGERAAGRVAELLATRSVLMSSVNLAEVIDVMSRRHGIAHERVNDALATLVPSILQIVAFDANHAERAGELRSGHYHRRDRPLSLADCALLATAADGDAVASADPHLLAVAGEIGLDPVELPAAN